MHVKPLQAAVSEWHVLKHPFYQLWNQGKLDQATLRNYAAQYYHHVAAFPRYVSAVHSHCERPEIRKTLLENLIEEERGADNHPELWLRFCEGLGLSRDEVLAQRPTPATSALVETFLGLANKSWAEGLAALYAYESQVPEVAQTKREGLARFYGVTSQRGLSFFDVHVEADKWHRESEEQIFSADVDEAQSERVVSSAKTAAKALWNFLDSQMPAGVEMSC